MGTDTATPVSEAVNTFARLTQRKRDLEHELNQIKDELKPLEEQILDELAANGWQNITHADSGYTFYIRRQIWARAADGEDRTAACRALKQAGLGDFVGETFNTHSLSAHFRELAEERVAQGDPVTDVDVLLPEELRGVIQLTTDHSLRAARS